MVMMLPFLTGLVAWFGMLGKRRPAVAFWIVTLGIFAAWCQYHDQSAGAVAVGRGDDLSPNPARLALPERPGPAASPPC